MVWNGSGSYTNTYYPTQDRDSGIPILASKFEDHFQSDLPQTFDNCVTRDGQGIITTDFNANNFKVKNVADATLPKDAINKQTFDVLETQVGTNTTNIGTNTTNIGTNTTNIGTNTTDISTLSNSFGSSLTTNGYQRISGGFILQWGRASLSGSSSSVTFPLSFSTVYNVGASFEKLNSVTNLNLRYVNSFTTTGFTYNSVVTSGNEYINWTAIGR